MIDAPHYNVDCLKQQFNVHHTMNWQTYFVIHQTELYPIILHSPTTSLPYTDLKSTGTTEGVGDIEVCDTLCLFLEAQNE